MFMLVVASVSSSQSTSETQTLAITSPINILQKQDLAKLPNASNLSTDGEINVGDAPSTLQTLFGVLPTKVAATDSETVVIIHVLGWKDAGHTAAKFDKWYVYDPHPHTYDFYVKTKQQLFEGTTIAGRTKYRFVYLHFNFDLNPDGSNPDESITQSCLDNLKSTWTVQDSCLIHPVSYNVAISKQQTQFIQDLDTVLQMVLPAAPLAAKELNAAPPPPVRSVGYWSYSDFTSQYSTSSIKITASLQSASAPIKGQPAGAAGQNNASNQLASQTYNNEKPSYIGLSFAVPVTSYKSVTYQSSSGTLVPSSITQQNVYVTFDAYFPAAQPGLTAFRWVPHPFAGLPIKGKVLQHTMAGLAIGLPWFEPFAGIVFDRQNASVNGESQRTTFKGIFGFKVSVSAVAKALKK
jgi:hypothetical protein